MRKLQETPPPPPPSGGGAPRGSMGHSQTSAIGAQNATNAPSTGPVATSTGAVQAVALENSLARFPTFEHVVELIRSNRDVKLLVEVEGCVRLANYQPGRIEFVPTENAPSDLAQRLGSKLQAWTGNRWAISVVSDGGQETISEKNDAADLALKAEASAHPMVQAVMLAFPKSKITEIRTQNDIIARAQADALPEVEDEWDPFEED